MKVIVTGASGFLGRAVVKELSRSSMDYIAVSRAHGNGLHVVSDYSKTPAGDVLIHLAENNNRRQVNQIGKPYQNDIDQNLEDLLNKGFKKVIYASSGLIYGDADPKPHKETDPEEINDMYTATKKMAETRILGHSSGVAVRLSNLYGPGMSPFNVLSDILKQINLNKDLQITSGYPVRDFLWIDDAASALCKLVKHFDHGIINVSSSQGTSISGLAELTLQLTGAIGKQVICAQNNTDYKVSTIILDNTKAMNTLDWAPRVALSEGVSKLLKIHSNPEP